MPVVQLHATDCPACGGTHTLSLSTADDGEYFETVALSGQRDGSQSVSGEATRALLECGALVCPKYVRKA